MMKSLVHAPVATYIMDPENRVEFLSDSWVELTGYQVGELLGFGYRAIVHPEDRSKHLDESARFAKIGVEYDCRIVTKSGMVKTVRVTRRSVFSSTGEFQGTSGTITDITERTVEGGGPHFLDDVDKHPVPGMAKNHLPTVSFDMDGTLCNTFQGFLDILAQRHPEDSYSWEDLFCSGNCRRCGTCLCSSSDLSRTHQNLRSARRTAFNTPRFWTTIEPFDREELALIRDQIQAQRFAAIFVATRRDLDTPGVPSDARLLSTMWLDNHEIDGYVGTVFDSVDKTRELLTRGVQYHVDDDPREVARAREHGVEAFLVSRPWNLGAECPYRVDSVRQFLDIVAPAEEGSEEDEFNAGLV